MQQTAFDHFDILFEWSHQPRMFLYFSNLTKITCTKISTVYETINFLVLKAKLFLFGLVDFESAD
jgi:hypothetical protein